MFLPPPAPGDSFLIRRPPSIYSAASFILCFAWPFLLFLSTWFGSFPWRIQINRQPLGAEDTTRSFLAVDRPKWEVYKGSQGKNPFSFSKSRCWIVTFFPIFHPKQRQRHLVSGPRLWGYRFRPLSSHLFGGAALTESKSSAMFFQSSQKTREKASAPFPSHSSRRLDVSLACSTLQVFSWART